MNASAQWKDNYTIKQWCMDFVVVYNEEIASWLWKLLFFCFALTLWRGFVTIWTDTRHSYGMF